MGREISPGLFRVGFFDFHRSISFAPFSKKIINTNSYSRLLREDKLICDSITSLDISVKKFFTDFRIKRTHGKNIVIIISCSKMSFVLKSQKSIDDLNRSISLILGDGNFSIKFEELRNPYGSSMYVANQIVCDVENRKPYKKIIQDIIKTMFLPENINVPVLRNHKVATINGVKIVASGRLSGAEMARVEVFKFGSLPTSTISADINYFSSTAIMSYGCIGFKVWIYKKDKVRLPS